MLPRRLRRARRTRTPPSAASTPRRPRPCRACAGLHRRDARPRGRRPVRARTRPATRCSPCGRCSPTAACAWSASPSPWSWPTAARPATRPTQSSSTTTRCPVVIDAEAPASPARRGSTRSARQPCCTLAHETEGFDEAFAARAGRGRQLTLNNQRLTPMSMETRGVRRRLGHVERRGHALHVHAGAALRAHVRGRRQRHPRVEGARGRARRRRRLRLEAELLRRGVRRSAPPPRPSARR